MRKFADGKDAREQVSPDNMPGGIERPMSQEWNLRQFRPALGREAGAIRAAPGFDFYSAHDVTPQDRNAAPPWRAGVENTVHLYTSSRDTI